MGEMYLIGLDIGSTTSSAMVATAQIVRNCVTGRMELGELSTVYHSEPVFTPFVGDELAAGQLAALFDRWIAESSVDPREITSGGAIVTGLAAQKKNAAVVSELARARFSETLIATADDPGLESWLAFMGNCFPLSRANPDQAFVNLDIGGGTTNLAWGKNGEVSRVGCYFIGARHLRFMPGTYRIEGLSTYAAGLLADLEITRVVGDELLPDELERILEFYVASLEAVVRGENNNPAFPKKPGFCIETVRRLEQVPYQPPTYATPVITLSGGVGELAYRHAQGEPLPGTTAFGDLGINFAQALCESPLLAQHLRTHVPTNLGRATVYGLTIHNTELSGSTLFLPRPDVLPLSDLPIVGRISESASSAEIDALLRLAQRSSRGACLQVELETKSHHTVKSLGERIAALLRENPNAVEHPLVLLVSGNIGKTLGQYATDWGRVPANLITIDEVAHRDAHFVSLGKPRDTFVPVSFYGLR